MDDEKIEKTIKRLFMTYQNKRRKILLHSFLKYRLITHKSKIQSNFSKNNILEIQENNSNISNVSNNSIYRKKKLQELQTSSSKTNKLRQLNNRNISTKNIYKTEGESNTPMNNIQYKQSDTTADFKTINSEEIFNFSQDENNKPNDVVKSMQISNPENFAIMKNKEIHNRLYEDGKRSKLLQNEIANFERIKEIRECTFSPKINKYRTISQTNSRDPGYIHLYEDRKAREQNLQHMSIEKEKKMNTLYSFSPSLNLTKNKTKICSKEFFERLKFYDNTKSEKFKKIKEEAQRIPGRSHKRKNSQSCVKNRETSTTLNISFDLVEYQNKKKKKLKQIEKSMLQEQGITFKPRLNEDVNMNINSSLIERSQEFVRNKSEKIKALKSKDNRECTFSPKVNNYYSKTNLINDKEKNSVGERLFKYQNIYKTNLENRKEDLKEYYKFKPEINKNTYDILKQRELMMNEIREKYDMNPKKKNADDMEENTPDDHIEKEESLNNMNLSESNKEDCSARMSKENSIPNLLEKNKIKDKSWKQERNENRQTLKNKSGRPDISDSRLMEMANDFIKTDESLELFQARMREKYSKFNSDRLSKINPLDMVNKELNKNIKSFNQNDQPGSSSTSSSHNKNRNANLENNINLNDSKKHDSKDKNKDNKLYTNFDEAFKYYNLLET